MRLRTLRRISQKDIAKELGVSHHTVSNWETGRSIPKLTIDQVKKLCDLLGCTLDELPSNFGPQPIPED